MNFPDADRAFTGSIPQLYEEHLVPMIFEPYAGDLASRVLVRRPSCVLETAAGTGVVTRHLAKMSPEETTIVATDLNQPMLDQPRRYERLTLWSGVKQTVSRRVVRRGRLSIWRHVLPG